MSESAFLVVGVGLSLACLLVLTVSFIWAMRDFRQFFRHAKTILPEFEETLRQTHQTLNHAHQLLIRSVTVVCHLENTSRHIQDAVSDFLQPLAVWTTRAKTWFEGHGKNGTRGEPRRRGRGVSKNRRRVR